MGFKTLVVVNPNSRNKATGKLWPEISKELEKHLDRFEYVFTSRQGHATDLTRHGIRDGYEMIVSVGGDGTNNEVVNGFFENGEAINPEAVFSSISMGTGGDLRRTLGTPAGYRDGAPILAGDATRRIDVGHMTITDHSGAPVDRCFLNITSFGIGGEVDARVNATTKVFGGFTSFMWGALGAMIGYKNKTVRLTIDDRVLEEQPVFNVAVANGQYHGGGMHVAPYAKMDDGLFDIVVIGNLTWGERIREMGKIYTGAHVHHKKVEYCTARKVIAESSETVLLDVDGEAPGKLPATFEILPSALRVKISG